MKKKVFTSSMILLTLILGGCKTIPMQDDGTNTFKSTATPSQPSMYDDGTNSAINQLIMSNLPKNTKSTSSKSSTNSSSQATKNNTTKTPSKVTSGSSTISSSKGTSKSNNSYTPPKVVLPNNNTNQFFYPIANPGIQAVKNGGIDFTVPANTPVYPSASGVVIFAGNKDSFGNAVFIYNDNNYITIYYNLASINVAKGDYIGDFSKPIGTGSGTFHFEIRQKTDTGIVVLDASKILQPRTQIQQ